MRHYLAIGCELPPGAIQVLTNFLSHKFNFARQNHETGFRKPKAKQLKTPKFRIEATAAVICGALLVFTMSVFAVRYFADEMLETDASRRARDWSANLVSHVADLPDILAGELPSDESIVFFEQAKLVGDVWQYRIYDAGGKLVVVSGRIGRTHQFTETLRDNDSTLLDRLSAGEIAVTVRQGVGRKEPGYLAEAIVAIRSGQDLLGYLAVIVDETETQTNFLAKAGQFAGTILLLVLAAFGVPAAAYLRRTRQKEAAETKLEHLAFHDSLTGLKNRHATMEFLEDHFRRNQGKTATALHFVDLDKFKEINDTLGHDAGDEVLRQVSSALVRAVAGEGVVGRVGGDEFLIVQTAEDSHSNAEVLAARVVQALAEPCEVNGSRVFAGVSVGTAIGPRHGETCTELIKSADIALYVAKTEGRGCYRVFKPEMDLKLKRRRDIQHSLREALASNGFVFHFQPLFDLETGEIEGVEALLRLPDETLGMISPGEFIPIAEETGLIGDIGDWVIAEGCRSLQLLPPHLKLAINLSPIQFEKGDVVASVRQALAATRIKPSRLELEVTESLLIKDTANVRNIVDNLKSLGVSIVLDDFGSGYSSLNYLWQYPFDKIKIDRSFISALGSNTNVHGIVESIIRLGKTLNMKVTAEGVENVAQADTLRSMHCGQVQGFLFAKPMAMADLAATLLRHDLAKMRPRGSELQTAQTA